MFVRRVVVALAVVWIAAWSWLGRYHMLDDALIHLRYAEMFAATHMFSFDGVVKSFGCSSPLYVALLAGLRTFSTSPLLPKAVSLVCYFGLLSWLNRRVFPRQPDRVDWGYVALMLAALSPMAMRWLTDGMETSLVVVMTTALVVLTVRQADRPGRPTVPEYLVMFVFGTALSVLRVDLAILAAIASLALVARRLENVGTRPTLRSVIIECFAQSHLAAGTIAAFGVTWLMTGQVLPDTAIAKATEAMPFLAAAWSIVRSTLSSFSFGAAMLLLWPVLMGAALAAGGRRRRWSILLGNLALVVVFVLIARRGQKIQGIRHLLWHYWFTALWNLEVLRTLDGSLVPSWLRRPPRALVGALAVALLGIWVVETRTTYKIMTQRGATYQEMASQHLGVLEGTAGIAYDVGFVSYFSNGHIYDMNGLVNGKEFAKLSMDERARAAAARSPEFVFLTDWQAVFVNRFVPLKDYVIWHKYVFANVEAQPFHHLAVRKDVAVKLGIQEDLRLSTVLY